MIGLAPVDEGPMIGSPKFGSASDNAKYLYLSEDNPVCGVSLDLPEIYFILVNYYFLIHS